MTFNHFKTRYLRNSRHAFLNATLLKKKQIQFNPDTVQLWGPTKIPRCIRILSDCFSPYPAGGPRDAQAPVHPPGLARHGRAVDAKGRVLPQAQAHQQPLGQAWICK